MNKKRVASDQLEFISFTKIDTYEVKSLSSHTSLAAPIIKK